MRIASLLYHDVFGAAGPGATGFPGGDADVYKLAHDEFTRHVARVAASAAPTAGVEAVLASGVRRAVLFTFDDGGVSAYDHTAPILESSGWMGHFFISTKWIGDPGFLTPAQLRSLHARGHVIGSHSVSHPPRISHCAPPAILAEWRDSVRRLEDIIGAPVRTASVPGGFYSRGVADAAIDAGITVLFNSEPTERVRHHEGCAILGRLSIMRADGPELAGAFAAGALLPRLKQSAYWNAKKVVKRVGGERWLALRKRLLRSR